MLSTKQFHSYQKRAFQHIIDNPRCGLFLDMGLGKTAITLTALRYLEHCEEVGKVLIIAPLRVAQNTWTAETAKWDYTQGMEIIQVLGTATNRKKALEQSGTYYIINRENTQWLIDYLGSGWSFDTIVIDELSSFKNHQAKRFKSLKRVLPHTKRVIGLTGTPAPNTLMDLWSQMYILDGGERLGKSITQYRNAYFRAGRRNAHIIYEWIPLAGSNAIISRKLSDICISMKKEDYLELPEIIYNAIEVTLPPKTLKEYKDFEREMVLSIGEDEEISSANAAVLVNQLKQYTAGAIYTDSELGTFEVLHNEKLDTLCEICDVATSPILVAYEFKHDKERILKAIPDARVIDTPQDVKDWNAGRIRVALGHPQSIGHGINLQKGGHDVVWYTLTWSLELYQQYNARLHRQGQDERVMVHHLTAKDTIDERVLQSLQTKDQRQSSLLSMVKSMRKQYEQERGTKR